MYRAFLRTAKRFVGNLEDQLTARSKSRAKDIKKSMEEEAQNILRNALREEETPADGLGTRISALFQQTGLQEEMFELRGHPPSIPSSSA